MMHEDETRLKREWEIFLATRGPDYARLVNEIRRNKAEAAHKFQNAMDIQARERIPPTPDGPYIAPDNPDARKREAHSRAMKAAELKATARGGR